MSVDADFVLALPFHHGDLEPYCACTSFNEERGVGAYREALGRQIDAPDAIAVGLGFSVEG